MHFFELEILFLWFPGYKKSLVWALSFGPPVFCLLETKEIEIGFFFFLPIFAFTICSLKEKVRASMVNY